MSSCPAVTQTCNDNSAGVGGMRTAFRQLFFIAAGFCTMENSRYDEDSLTTTVCVHVWAHTKSVFAAPPSELAQVVPL